MRKRGGVRPDYFVTHDIGERCSSLPMNAAPQLHINAAQIRDTGTVSLILKTETKQDQGSGTAMDCGESDLYETALISSAYVPSLSPRPKKGSDTLRRVQPLRLTDGHLDLRCQAVTDNKTTDPIYYVYS